MSWQPQGPVDPYQEPQPGPWTPAGGQPTYPQATYPQAPYPQAPVYGPPPVYGQPGYGPPPVYGQPGYPQQWGVPAVARHRPWSTSLVWVFAVNVVLSALGSLAVLLDGGFESLIDPGQTAGIDPAIYTGIITVVLSIAFLVSAGLVVWAVMARRAADHGRPGPLRGLAITTIVFGGLATLGALSSIAQGEPPFGLLFAGLYLGIGIKLVAVLRA